MDEDEVTPRMPRIWRWVSLIGVAIVAAPVVLWLIVFFVRSTVFPPRVIYRPVAATVAPEPAASGPVALANEPALPPLSTGSTTNSLAIAAADSFTARLSELPQAAIETEPGEPIAGPIPLPPHRPKVLIAAITGRVPVPRPRPSFADDQDEPVFQDERPDYR
jgi:hypothetical protein